MKTINTRTPRVAALSMAVALTGSNQNDDSSSGGSDGPPELPDARDEPSRYRVNPNPTKKYEITVRAKNAPGPLQLTRGSTEFMAPNCRYTIERFAGVTGSPRVSIPVEFKPVGDGVYKGYVYLDQMLDENYWGQGVCNWKMTFTSAALGVTSAGGQTEFSNSISLEEVVTERPDEVCYFNKDYHVTQKHGVPLSYSNPEVCAARSDRMFGVELSSKKVN